MISLLLRKNLSRNTHPMRTTKYPTVQHPMPCIYTGKLWFPYSSSKNIGSKLSIWQLICDVMDRISIIWAGAIRSRLYRYNVQYIIDVITASGSAADTNKTLLMLTSFCKFSCMSFDLCRCAKKSTITASSRYSSKTAWKE